LLGIAEDAVFPLAECPACGFVYAKYLPPAEFLDQVYDAVIDQEVAREQSESLGRMTVLYHLGGLLCGELEVANPDQAVFRVLDFGCGYGTLVRALSSSRIHAVGFETSARRIEHMRSQGLRVCSKAEELRQDAPFDAITLVDVLEHVALPRDVLTLCRGLLSDGGFLVVAVPSFTRARVAAIRKTVERGEPLNREVNPWEHLYYFSPSSLDRLLRACGFSPQEPLGSVDVGLRSRLRGVRRMGNSVKSLLRTVSYAFGGYAPNAVRVAHKRSGIGSTRT
jgi:2-polyprenyl-3-methyl-5-hydroxy-6-metoxy-1,4-benzoquinol methylase